MPRYVIETGKAIPTGMDAAIKRTRNLGDHGFSPRQLEYLQNYRRQLIEAVTPMIREAVLAELGRNAGPSPLPIPQAPPDMTGPAPVKVIQGDGGAITSDTPLSESAAPYTGAPAPLAPITPGQLPTATAAMLGLINEQQNLTLRAALVEIAMQETPASVRLPLIRKAIAEAKQ